GRVRTSLRPGGVRQEDDRYVGEQRMVEVVEEFDRYVLQRDDEVETHAAVFHLQEITKPLPIGAVRKPRDVDEFGVVVEVSGEAVVEHARQLAFANDGELRVPSCGVQSEHLLVIGLRVDSAREHELRE